MRDGIRVPPVLIVPGYGGSPPDHWQSHLERRLAPARRVEMPSWRAPRRAGWIAALDRAVLGCPLPPVLVAHSLGCIAVAHWAAATRRDVCAALLVAPCDVDRSPLSEALRDFAPLPREKLEFPSVIAASSDDPHLEVERAQDLAHDWGARLRVLGARGHINVAAGFGSWLEGEALLAELLAETLGACEGSDRRLRGRPGADATVVTPLELSRCKPSQGSRCAFTPAGSDASRPRASACVRGACGG